MKMHHASYTECIGLGVDLRKNTLLIQLRIAQNHKSPYTEAVFYFGKVNAPQMA